MRYCFLIVDAAEIARMRPGMVRDIQAILGYRARDEGWTPGPLKTKRKRDGTAIFYRRDMARERTS